MRAARAAACRVPRALYNTADTVFPPCQLFYPWSPTVTTPPPPGGVETTPQFFEMRAASPPLSRSAYRGLKHGGVGFAVPLLLLLLAAFNGSGSRNKLRLPFRSLTSQIKVRAQPKVTAPVQKGQSICGCNSQLIY